MPLLLQLTDQRSRHITAAAGNLKGIVLSDAIDGGTRLAQGFIHLALDQRIHLTTHAGDDLIHARNGHAQGKGIPDAGHAVQAVGKRPRSSSGSERNISQISI